jgi:hypothetical protein
VNRQTSGFTNAFKPDVFKNGFFSRKAGNGGQELEKQVTAMGFTTLSEYLPPTEVVDR